MHDELSQAFISYASDILADTQLGLSGQQIVKITVAHAVEWNVSIPHEVYPFKNSVPNKRTALCENLMAFSEAQRYQILRELCDHPTVRERNGPNAEKLQLMLIARYGHLAGENLGSEIDAVLIQRTQHWLGPFPEVLEVYNQAVQKHENRIFLRNVLDDLRLGLEILLKSIFQNDKSLEKQISLLGDFIQQRGGSRELVNMFVKLVDYYAKYQNSYVKHDDAVVEEEVEFIFELTSSFMKHIVRLSYKNVV